MAELLNQRSGAYGADVELARDELAAIVDQIALSVVRTARSTVVRDLMDFSTAVAAADGTLLAQNAGILLHMAAIPQALTAALAVYPEPREGDVIVLNDPYQGGTHLPDVVTLVPVFDEGERIAFTCVVAHHLDMGGHWPGSRATGCREIFQEGFRFPPVLLYEQNRLSELFVRLLETNVRTPKEVVGDLISQVTACMQAAGAIRALCRRYGRSRLRARWDGLLSYSEDLTRLAIRELPEGEAEFTDHLDDDGVSDTPVTIKAAVRIAQGHIHVDFAGSDAQVESGINTNLAGACSGVYFAVHAALHRRIPDNAGFQRCISVQAPEGSVVNARFPAPVAGRGVTIHRVGDVVLGALGKLYPDRVWAAGEGGPSGANIGGWTKDGPFIISDIIGGGSGARPNADGVQGVFCPTGNSRNIPVEVLENDCPIRITRYELCTDSGGAGRFRGANALVKEYLILCDRAQMFIRSDRQKFEPWGLAGGMPGAKSANILIHADGTTEHLPPKIARDVVRGDRIIHRQAGGGGYGEPSDRDRALVESDRVQGYISEERHAWWQRQIAGRPRDKKP